MLLLEILAVTGAILILFLCSLVTARKAIGLGKTAGRVTGNTGRKVIFLAQQAEAAQRRAFSIMQSRDTLFVHLFALRETMAKTKVIVSAAREAWARVSRVLDYVGV